MKLSWPGFTHKATLVIAVDSELFQLSKGPVMILNESFNAKDELHITLIGKKQGALILDKVKRNRALELSLKRSFESIDWSFKPSSETILIGRKKETIDETGMVQTVDQKSVITRTEMTGMALFYKAMKSIDLIHADTPVPPPHITL